MAATETSLLLQSGASLGCKEWRLVEVGGGQWRSVEVGGGRRGWRSLQVEGEGVEVGGGPWRSMSESELVVV